MTLRSGIPVRRMMQGCGVEIYDISQTLCEGMAVWPGDPEFRQRRIMRRQDGKSANTSTLHMGVHAGTHVDAPLHLDDSGSDIARMPLRCFIGPARVFEISARECIRADDLTILDWRGVERVLFKTRAASRPDYMFDTDFVYFDEGAAEFLVKRGILLVGTDAPSIDAFDSVDLPSHRMLLSHEIAILEAARLRGVPPGNYELACLPLKLAGSDGSPVRAILRSK
jgi:arylformamidase